MILTNEGGTLGLSGINTDPKFSFPFTSYTLNQSISKMVISPGSSSVIVSLEYSRRGSKL